MIVSILLTTVNLAFLALLMRQLLRTTKENSRLLTMTNLYKEQNNQLIVEIQSLTSKIESEKNKAANILSQKKSSETRLGQISENLVPFLENFKYDPKTAHFLGSPLDYVIFDTESEDPAVIFLEIKTGNSKLSNSQKTIKNLVKTGKVRFEEFRLDQKGQRVKTTKNEDQ